jgi:hypothetical protein
MSCLTPDTPQKAVSGQRVCREPRRSLGFFRKMTSRFRTDWLERLENKRYGGSLHGRRWRRCSTHQAALTAIGARSWRMFRCLCCRLLKFRCFTGRREPGGWMGRVSVVILVSTVTLRQMPLRIIRPMQKRAIGPWREHGGLQPACMMRDHPSRSCKRQRALHRQQTAQQQDDQVSNRYTHATEFNTMGIRLSDPPTHRPAVASIHPEAAGSPA